MADGVCVRGAQTSNDSGIIQKKCWARKVVGGAL